MHLLLAVAKEISKLLTGGRCLDKLLQYAVFQVAAQFLELGMILDKLQISDHRIFLV